MAVVIRMKRSGRRNRPCYRISVADSRDPRDGRVLENLGLYDPVSPKVEAQVQLNVERARHWLQHGALPSETVASIFKREGVYEEGRREKKKRSRPGRKKVTQARVRRVERARRLEESKKARASERNAARAAAKKAAKAAESEGEAES